MPGILATTSWNRRRFLQGSAGAAISTVWPCRGEEDAASKTRRWALLADTHVAGDRERVARGENPYDNLCTAAVQVRAARVEGTLIIGDVAMVDGQPEDYETVKHALQPLADEVPVFLGMGNHDDRKPFHRAFPEAPEGSRRPAVKEKHVVVMDQSPVVRIVLLDSLHQVNQASGELGEPQRSWLTDYLKESGEEVPVVIAVHHTLGQAAADLQDASHFFRILEEAPQVKAVFYGHSHRFGITKRGGLHLINLPPVGYAFDAETELGWLEADFTPSGCHLTRHTLDGAPPAAGARKEIGWADA